MTDLTRLRPEQVHAQIERQPILVLPFGTVEWHGPHLPLGLDGLVADDLGTRIADRCGAARLPTSYWAVGGVPFPYTLTLSLEIIEPLLVAVLEQFGAMGFRVIVAFTGHYGLDQTLALKRAAVEVMDRSPVTVLPLTAYDLVADEYAGDHAGVGETSLLLSCLPDLVDLDAVPANEPLLGVIGEDPRGLASAEHGRSLAAAITARGADLATWFAHDATALDRRQFLEALRAGVATLERTRTLRRTLPKAQVPPIATDSYLDHCVRLARRDFVGARKRAEDKLGELVTGL